MEKHKKTLYFVRLKEKYKDEDTLKSEDRDQEQGAMHGM